MQGMMMWRIVGALCRTQSAHSAAICAVPSWGPSAAPAASIRTTAHCSCSDRGQQAASHGRLSAWPPPQQPPQQQQQPQPQPQPQLQPRQQQRAATPRHVSSATRHPGPLHGPSAPPFLAARTLLPLATPPGLPSTSAAASAAAAAAARAWGRSPPPPPPLCRGLVDFALAPRPLPRMRKLDKELAWRRMVIRIPPEVGVTLRDHTLHLSGRTGDISVDLRHMDPTGLVGMQLVQGAPPSSGSSGSSSGSGGASGSSSGGGSGGDSGGALLLCVSPSKRHFRGIATHVGNAVRGVTQGYLVGLTVKGVGYRIDPVDPPPARKSWHFERGPEPKLATVFPVQSPAAALRLKVGFTSSAVFPLPPGVRAFLVRPTLAYLYGVDKALVRSTAAAVRRVRPPNVYTGNGIQLVGEALALKPRGGKK